jgi:hypothetical protein
MQLISLTTSIQVWMPNASLPVEAVALLGTVDDVGAVRRTEVKALVPPCGGLLTFRVAVVLMLTASAIAATQDVTVSAVQPMPTA